MGIQHLCSQKKAANVPVYTVCPEVQEGPITRNHIVIYFSHVDFSFEETVQLSKLRMRQAFNLRKSLHIQRMRTSTILVSFLQIQKWRHELLNCSAFDQSKLSTGNGQNASKLAPELETAPENLTVNSPVGKKRTITKTYRISLKMTLYLRQTKILRLKQNSTPLIFPRQMKEQ